MYKVKRTCNKGIQAGTPSHDFKTRSTQCETTTKSSYGRNQTKTRKNNLTYDELHANYLSNNETLIEWLKKYGLLAKEVLCHNCKEKMKCVLCKDRLDGLKFECRGKGTKRHRMERSIRQNTWFEKSNMTLHEILKLTYWWSIGLTQEQIMLQLQISSSTVVDWCMFCREVCEVTIEKGSQQIDGKGKRVQIDESKVGKRKYHKGHYVEGQWIFGGIEENSRKCFLIAVEDRTEATLLSLIKKWISPGTVIISDCWKAYHNLDKHGYTHKTVNHSQEFKNEDGDHTNKIEGHWRQMKASFPTHGRKKQHYSSYLAEFIWRYTHREDDLFWAFLTDVKKIYDPNSN